MLAGKRRLKNRYLDFMTSLDHSASRSLFCFENSGNLTEILHSLKLLVKTGNGDHALSTFYKKWTENPHLIDKWFSIQAIHTPPDQILKVLETLI